MIESSTLAVDASELDLSATDNMSLATSAADDVWLASSVDVDSSCCLQVPTVAGTGAERDRSTDIEDSTEDEQSMSLLLCVVLINVCSLILISINIINNNKVMRSVTYLPHCARVLRPPNIFRHHLKIG